MKNFLIASLVLVGSMFMFNANAEAHDCFPVARKVVRAAVLAPVRVVQARPVRTLVARQPVRRNLRRVGAVGRLGLRVVSSPFRCR